MSEDEKSKLAKKREYVVKEIISTERTYLSRLQITVDLYVSPLKTGKILDQNDVRNQFELLESILELHQKYAVTDENADSLDYIRLFEDVTNSFKVYSDYLVNYEPAMQRRGYLITSNRRFSDFVDKTQKEPLAMGQGMESLLILPVQRIPRYRLLLEQLLKCTPEDHPDYTSVKTSLDKICDLAIYNNEAIRARENRTKIMAIMMQFEPRSRIDLLDDSNRRYIKDGPLNRQCRRGVKEFHFWLFTDVLLYGQALPIGVYMLNRKISLAKCMVSSCESIYSNQHAFVVQSPAKSFIVQANNNIEKDEWMKAIIEAMNARRERISQRRGSVAPIWEPDSHSTTCQKCKSKFSIIYRRHHCRNCGAIVCEKCSNKRYLLAHVNEKTSVRVCNDCYTCLSAHETIASKDEDDDVNDNNDNDNGKRQQRSGHQQQRHRESIDNSTMKHLSKDEIYLSDGENEDTAKNHYDDDDEDDDEDMYTRQGRTSVDEDALNDFNEGYEDLSELLRQSELETATKQQQQQQSQSKSGNPTKPDKKGVKFSSNSGDHIDDNNNNNKLTLQTKELTLQSPESTPASTPHGNNNATSPITPNNNTTSITTSTTTPKRKSLFGGIMDNISTGITSGINNTTNLFKSNSGGSASHGDNNSHNNNHDINSDHNASSISKSKSGNKDEEEAVRLGVPRSIVASLKRNTIFNMKATTHNKQSTIVEEDDDKDDGENKVSNNSSTTNETQHQQGTTETVVSTDNEVFKRLSQKKSENINNNNEAAENDNSKASANNNNTANTADESNTSSANINRNSPSTTTADNNITNKPPVRPPRRTNVIISVPAHIAKQAANDEDD